MTQSLHTPGLPKLEIAGVLLGDDTYWILQHREGIEKTRVSPDKAGLWGGQLEPSDNGSPLTAAYRELAEETSAVLKGALTPLNTYEFDHYDPDGNPIHKVIYAYVGFTAVRNFEIFEGRPAPVLVPRGVDGFVPPVPMIDFVEVAVQAANVRFPPVRPYDIT